MGAALKDVIRKRHQTEANKTITTNAREIEVISATCKSICSHM